MTNILYSDFSAIPLMSDEELLEYFLFRISETDEVWGLKAGIGWMTRQVEGLTTQPVWPFKTLAEQAAVADWQTLKAQGESVEYFIYQLLPRLGRQQILIEIMPRPDGVGCLINPARLSSYLEGMRDSGECMVED